MSIDDKRTGTVCYELETRREIVEFVVRFECELWYDSGDRDTPPSRGVDRYEITAIEVDGEPIPESIIQDDLLKKFDELVWGAINNYDFDEVPDSEDLAATKGCERYHAIKDGD